MAKSTNTAGQKLRSSSASELRCLDKAKAAAVFELTWLLQPSFSAVNREKAGEAASAWMPTWPAWNPWSPYLPASVKSVKSVEKPPLYLSAKNLRDLRIEWVPYRW